MISIAKHFLFIHIPKTAGTAIEETIEDDSCVCKRNQVDDKAISFKAPLNHLTLAQIVEGDFVPAQELKDYFKFTFVRNPWSRVISECFCPHIRLIFKDCNDIPERIQQICNYSTEGYGGHCRRQTDFIRSESLSLDFIGRYENLAPDMDYVLQKIGYTDRMFNVMKNTWKNQYREFYDDVTRKLVEETYGEEIEEFHYSF